MDLSSFVGVFCGFAVIGAAILSGGSLSTFIDLPSILIVFGGITSAVAFSFTLSDLGMAIRLAFKTFGSHTADPLASIQKLLTYSQKIRKDGYLAIKRDAELETDSFLRKGLTMLVDQAETELISDTLQTEIIAMRDRHKKGQQLFRQMAKYAPAFGMIGTLVGLIQMLSSMNDPSNIGPKMAVALITTFYGAMLANLVFTPIAAKLQMRSSQELLEKTVILNGLCAISERFTPYQMEDRLMGFLEQNRRKHFEEWQRSQRARIRAVA